MPFSKANSVRYRNIAAASEAILDSNADEQTKLIGAVIATQGLHAVTKEVDSEIYNGGRDDWGHTAAFKEWNKSHKIDELDAYQKLSDDLTALGFSDDVVSATLAKTSAYITNAYVGDKRRA